MLGRIRAASLYHIRWNESIIRIYQWLNTVSWHSWLFISNLRLMKWLCIIFLDIWRSFSMLNGALTSLLAFIKRGKLFTSRKHQSWCIRFAQNWWNHEIVFGLSGTMTVKHYIQSILWFHLWPIMVPVMLCTPIMAFTRVV